MEFERVHTIWDYYDGPREGLADFGGQPHHYKCVWDVSADDWSRWYALIPVDPDTFRLAMEQWAIWLAWQERFRAGEAPLESHPGHGGRNARYDELEAMLEERMPSQSSTARTAEATFDLVDGKNVVQWSLSREK